MDHTSGVRPEAAIDAESKSAVTARDGDGGDRRPGRRPAGRGPQAGTEAVTDDRSEQVVVAQGGHDQIAGRLTISVRTVTTHVSHLLAKLAARDRAHLVIAAYDAGLVTPRR